MLSWHPAPAWRQPRTPFTNNGPYRDLDADYCGDTVQNDGDIYHELKTLHIKCTDTLAPAYGRDQHVHELGQQR